MMFLTSWKLALLTCGTLPFMLLMFRVYARESMSVCSRVLWWGSRGVGWGGCCLGLWGSYTTSIQGVSCGLFLRDEPKGSSCRGLVLSWLHLLVVLLLL